MTKATSIPTVAGKPSIASQKFSATHSGFCIKGFKQVIGCSKLVTDVYGYWPKFEGAYVISAKIEASSFLFYELGERTLTIELHWWLGAKDHYPDGPLAFKAQDLHHRICIAFCVEDLRVHTFFCSNPQIFGLLIEGDSGTVACEGGFEMSFTYTDARVLSVSPCDEIGEPL